MSTEKTELNEFRSGAGDATKNLISYEISQQKILADFRLLAVPENLLWSIA